MKFKSSIPPTYQPDTVKSVIKWAWWPKKIGSIIVWMGRYEVLYVCKVGEIQGIYNGQPSKWTLPQWVKVSEHAL